MSLPAEPGSPSSLPPPSSPPGSDAVEDRGLLVSPVALAGLMALSLAVLAALVVPIVSAERLPPLGVPIEKLGWPFGSLVSDTGLSLALLEPDDQHAWLMIVDPPALCRVELRSGRALQCRTDRIGGPCYDCVHAYGAGRLLVLTPDGSSGARALLVGGPRPPASKTLDLFVGPGDPSGRRKVVSAAWDPGHARFELHLTTRDKEGKLGLARLPLGADGELGKEEPIEVPAVLAKVDRESKVRLHSMLPGDPPGLVVFTPEPVVLRGEQREPLALEPCEASYPSDCLHALSRSSWKTLMLFPSGWIDGRGRLMRRTEMGITFSKRWVLDEGPRILERVEADGGADVMLIRKEILTTFVPARPALLPWARESTLVENEFRKGAWVLSVARGKARPRPITVSTERTGSVWLGVPWRGGLLLLQQGSPARALALDGNLEARTEGRETFGPGRQVLDAFFAQRDEVKGVEIPLFAAAAILLGLGAGFLLRARRTRRVPAGMTLAIFFIPAVVGVLLLAKWSEIYR
jgi:hypothetical protein